MRHLNYFLLFGFLLSFQLLQAQNEDSTTIIDTDTLLIKTTIERPAEIEELLLDDILEQFYVNVRTEDDQEYLEVFTACSDDLLNGKTTISVNGEPFEVIFKDCQTRIPYEIGEGKLILISKGSRYEDYRLMHISPQEKVNAPYRIKYIPLWMSIVPPLVAIILALIFKEVIISLFIGIWSGAFIANGMRFDPVSIVLSFYDVVSNYIIGALTDSGHMSVIIFSLMIGGMVAIISRNGGMAGVVEKLSKYAKSPKSTELVTWVLGVAIFFDDYANTLIVGNTMRPVTDKFKISREKLAYIVDSTAAPVAAIAFITTWIGVELGYIKDNMHDLVGLDVMPSAYAVFLSSLQYSFYPIFTLGFILILIFTRRDFGPMLKAEIRARGGEVSKKRGKETVTEDMEDLAPVAGAKLRWYNAAIPVIAVISVTIVGLVATGMETSLANLVGDGYTGDGSMGAIWSNLQLLSDAENIGFFERLGILIGNADSYTALIWASLSGLFLGILLTLGGGIMKLEDTMNTMLAGFRTMLPALMILALAWSLGTLTEELNTATFLTSALQDTLPPTWMPVVIFVLAGAIAFSTGSSWSTMAILYPIAIPSTWAICMASGYEAAEALPILYNVIATVLAASVFGDHCSPISDTTILSSLASDCNHIDHVRTQLPYAATVGLVSLAFAYTSTAFGLPAFANFLIGFVILYLIVRVFGRVID
jgi:Na+/H+ antiporter NhaC